MARLWLTELAVLLGLASPVMPLAEGPVIRGMVLEVKAEQRVLVLETRGGVREVSVAGDVVIRDQHGRSLMLEDLRPGDGAANRRRADGRTELSIAQQFWAVPMDN